MAPRVGDCVYCLERATILLDGVDAFPVPGATPGMACRLYSTSHGVAGVPGSRTCARRSVNDFIHTEVDIAVFRLRDAWVRGLALRTPEAQSCQKASRAAWSE